MNYHSNLSEISEKVKNFGVIKKENWLDQEDIKKTKLIIEKINCAKGNNDGVFYLNLKFKIIELFKLKFRKIAYEKYFVNLSRKLGLKKIADQIFDFPAKLTRVDCYTNPISNAPVLDWHVDNAYSGRKDVDKFLNPEKAAIKFFFYLSDVYTDNGCLSYIPKSHLVAFALRKGIYEKAIKYTPYWSLSDFRKTILIKENFNYIKSNLKKEDIDDFLSYSEFIEKENSDNKKYDLAVKCGGAVIFDEGGVHRGSKLLKTNRLALRYFFERDKKF